MNIPESLKPTLKNSPLIIGVGPSAWPRIISSFYFPKFKAITYYNCQDNDLIRKSGVEVFSIKEHDPDFELSPVTPGNILNTPLVKKYLAEQTEPFALLVYKSFGKLEKICDENGWRFIGNKKALIDTYENKRIFKETIRKLGIESIPGDNIPVENLTPEVFLKYQETLHSKTLVLQIAEMTYGGGSGTLFMSDPSELSIFTEKIAKVREKLEGKKKKIETVNIAPYIQGQSCSIACCATKFGTLTGTIQSQIIDVESVGAVLENRSGAFAGHDWSFIHFPEDAQIQAQKIAQKFGAFLYEQGYKGIFGLDLIVDTNGKVWPVECNPRETDAFPLICMLQMEAGATPMAIFHNLEHLDIPYEINFEEVDKSYKNQYNASQILLYNKFNDNGADRGIIQAGVYTVKDNALHFVREGFMLSDIKDESEFLLTESVGKEIGYSVKSHERIIRFIKRGGILKEDHILKDDVLTAVNLVYKKFRIVEAQEGIVEQDGVVTFFSNRLIDANRTDLTSVDIVNTVNPYTNGIRRPLKISWRKDITPETPVLEQIPSKNTRKNILYDLEKIEKMGIEVRVVENIDNAQYLDWLTLYKEVMGKKERGHAVIGENWLQKKQAAGKSVGAVFLMKGSEIMGGDLFLEVKGVLGVGYGVAQRIEGLRGGLGLLLDYYFLKHAQNRGYSQVSFGQDSNLYGFDLSVGLAFYKMKLGFYPVPANKTYAVTTYFRNFNKMDGPIIIFTGNALKVTGITLLTSNETEDVKSLQFNENFLPDLIRTVIKKEKIVEKNSQIVKGRTPKDTSQD